jgi:positive regulator of sigma E activity
MDPSINCVPTSRSSGLVIGEQNGKILVKTESVQKACEQKGCSGCITFGSPQSTINILASCSASISPGEMVEIEQDSGATMRAVWWLLILPTLLMVVAIGIAEWKRLDEGWILFICVGLMGIYFLVLKSFASKMVSYQIRETHS